MSIQTYSAERITMLKQTLLNSAEAGKPRDYEIRVDDMKVVPRTNDTEQFDNYEEFVTEETKKIIVLIYDGTSRRNEKYIYLCKDEKKEKNAEKELSGTVEKILEKERMQQKNEQLEKENKELKEQLEQNEKDFEKVIAHNKKLEAGRDLEDVQWGKILGAAGDTLLRSNTKFLAKIPALQGLAGIIEADTKEREKQIDSPKPEVEASYSMKSEQNENKKNEEPEKKENKNEEKENPIKGSQTSEEERDRIGLIRQLNQHFEKKQVEQVFSLLNLLINNPKAIEPTLNFAKEKKAQSTDKTKSETANPENKKPEPKQEQQFKKHSPETKQQVQSEKQEEKSEEQSTEIKPVNLENATEQTTLQGIENQNKENANDEIPNSM